MDRDDTSFGCARSGGVEYLQSAGLVADGGRLASTLGFTGEELTGRDLTVVPVMANPDDATLTRLAADAASGLIRVPIIATYPLEQAGRRSPISALTWAESCPAASPSTVKFHSTAPGQLAQPATFQAARTFASVAAPATPRMGCSSMAGAYLLAGTFRPSASAMARTWCGAPPQHTPM